MVDVATQVAVGASLKELGFKSGLVPPRPYVAVKAPVFSFAKMQDVDISLGPEMKSTGEVMGIDYHYARALYKAITGAGMNIPVKGRILFTVADKDKDEMKQLAKAFSELGFELAATEGTAKAIRSLGIDADIVGKVTIALADQYTRSKGNNHTYIFHKTALSRKHVAAGPVPLTGRTVITSLTGVIDPTALPIPWNMALGILEIHITSHLYRQGMVPWAAMEYIDLSSTERLPIIERFFDRMEADRKAIIEAGRNPSIEYLSLRSFFMMVNRNLEDESIKLPITTVGAYNADFDGEQLPSLNFSN